MVNGFDRRCEEGGNGEHGEFVAALFRGDRHRVGHHDRPQRRLRQALDGATGEDTMHSRRLNRSCPLRPNEPGRLDDRASAGNLIVDNQRGLAGHIANQMHRLWLLVVAMAAFIHNRQGQVETMRIDFCALGLADVPSD